MEWIYLSPHFDDVALSCGGLVWEQVRAGQPASIWTICAGEQPAGTLSTFAQSLHQRWQAGEQAVSRRRAEDIASCQVLGASWRHFDLPDCIYRPGGESGDFYYPSEESLWSEVHHQESRLVDELSQTISRDIPPSAEVVCPLALGGHVDHRLTRAVAERLGKQPWYYLDYPYVLKETAVFEILDQASLHSITFAISKSGLEAWQASIAAHQSQISTFWPDLHTMRNAISTFCERMNGIKLAKRL